MSAPARPTVQTKAAFVLRCFVGVIGLSLVPFSAFAQTSVNVAAAANGGVATASSTFSASYPPSGAIDGDHRALTWNSAGAWNDGTPNAFPDWLQVNFNGTKLIGEIDVFMLQDNMATLEPTPTMTFTQYGLTAFQVQYWNGSAWVDVTGGNVTDNNLVWRRFTFTPISTDRIRVLVNNSAATYSCIVEVEAWTSVFANLTAPANNATFAAPATVNLAATAGDSVGTLSKVEFYRNATLVATVTTPSSGTSSSGSYTASDLNVAAGTYSYTAKAYDSGNPSALASSSAVVVSVAPPAGSVNVAAAANGGVATASSTFSASYPPSGAIDGDHRALTWNSAGAWNDGTPNAFPDWLQVNFSGVKLISEIDVFMLQDNIATLEPTPTMTFTQYGLTAFQVQHWNGSAWVDVTGGNVTDNNLVWRRFTFTPISTNRIRVLVNNSLATYSCIVELEAWSAVGPPPVDYQISGTATLGGAPLAGVTFATTNGGTCTPSDAAGQYACTVAQGWSGSVTSSRSGYTFSPALRSYDDVQVNQTGQDFAAAGASAVRVYYIDTDHLNTPRLIADGTGAAVWRWNQVEPFGNDVPNNNPSGAGAFDFPLRFPGQYFDRETNLAYNLRRDYDPATGRYVQSDPIGLLSGINTYSYVESNPLRWIDPLGLVTWPTDYANVIDPYGSRGGTHNGADIRNPNGGNVYSTQDGTVSSVTSGGPGGNQIIIRNSDGSVSGYAHTQPNSEIAPGQSVSEGQTIGYSDASGIVTGAHTHYTYRPCVECSRIDPMTQLPKGLMCTGK